MSATMNAAAAARNKALLRVLPWAVILVVWQGVRSAGLVSPGLLPAPSQIVATAWALLLDGSLLRHVGASAGRVTLGVLIGVTLAVPAGFALGRFVAVRTAFDPLVNFFRALPPIALVPLVIIYLGIGEAAKISVLAFSAFFAAVIVLYEGVSQIAPIYTHVALTLGASQGEVFRKVILPLAAPHVLTALRVSLGVAWATLVAAELVAAQAGLGAMIQMAASFFQLEVIYVGIVAIGVVALSMDFALRRLSRRVLSWQERLPS
jgi:NitT/TauT family transport system permease protein